ncbi:glycoside hydrolase family 32 protein [Vibrio salinus]|uniref:glycoside hydrolase family 32 protein n=1 Tax=Vibrio salinus TaxID=2899784 RepID=UPI001E43020B|nr:glycoside hydrolase family 32 protein [Vibrio salinus]MCE0495233.1 glycoside hydrolase family 32 protein [Vibrio salinus]
MHLNEFIRLAGGIQNILRVLLPQKKVALCVSNPDLVAELPADVELKKVLTEWHLISGSVCTTESELLELGKDIGGQLRAKAMNCFEPTESVYRPGWHVSPPVGLLNDPNGFIYHEGKYHLCYQWYPYDCVHKDKYWVQMSSDDLVNWKRESVALTPSDWFDSHGVYSGHAISHEGRIIVFYTGNARIGEERIRQTTQCAAVSDDGVHYEKLGPLIPCPPEGVTGHIRDPKVIFRDGIWWMFLGAQTDELKGRLAVYKSSDLKEWKFDGLYGDELANGNYGYMWECPDVFEFDGQFYLAFSPQGIESHSPLNTLPHHNRIAVLTFTDEGGIEIGEPVILDYGFDFYAYQSVETPDSRRVMIGWMGLPDEVNQPSCDQGWIHQFSLPRELNFAGGRLIQKPCRELKALRGDEIEFGSETEIDLGRKQFELMLTLQSGGKIQLFADDKYSCDLTFETDKQRLLLDRSNTEQRESDLLRELPVNGEEVRLHILADNSSVEIFINDGEAVMTSRVFTPASATRLILGDKVKNVSGYYLNGARLPFANQ